MTASSVAHNDPTFWDPHPWVISSLSEGRLDLVTFFQHTECGTDIRVLILRSVYKRPSFSLSFSGPSHWLHHRKQVALWRASCGKEQKNQTTLEELNPADHHVSELGSGISPALTRRYRL